MTGIPGSEHFRKVEPVRKGQSCDKKYRVETDEGTFLLVRIGDGLEPARKRAEYEMQERAFAAGVPTPRPLGFGLRTDGSTYSVAYWCEGADAEAILSALNARERYALGVKSGALLRLIHEIPAPCDAEPWGIRFRRKVSARVSAYEAMPDKPPGGDVIRDWLTEHRALLDSRPQTFNHGDFNAGNLIVAPNGALWVIDFNAYNGGYGDPWWELGENADPDYLNGQLAGYFDGAPPRDYFPVCAYYAAYGALDALCDTYTGEYGMPAEGIACLERVLGWFDGMRADIPSWYCPPASPGH